ncbi:5137_t:CDS:1, partial [Acaulospora colombiana]
DESPPLLSWSPTAAKIRARVEEVLGHPINHALIQLYRSGNDYISEHSDKTIDVVRGSNIVNVSLGAERVMILRTKKDTLPPKDEETGQVPERTAQRFPLPHNSMFIMGSETNKRWLHGIRQDKREAFLKTKGEMDYDGERISLTFRHIATFLSADQTQIYGQGATGKAKSEAKPVINGDKDASQRMIDAFGFENQQSDFDWDATYGAGFDVLHFTNLRADIPRKPLLYFVNGSIPSWRVKAGHDITPLQPAR